MYNAYISSQKIARLYPLLKQLFVPFEKSATPVDDETNAFDSPLEECCHYTSTEVLDIILKKSTFRASHLLYLNDSSELISGIEKLKNIKSTNDFDGADKIRQVVESINAERLPGPFSISFCSESDLLHQWITYAKESGVCMVLDGNLFPSLFFQVLPKQEKPVDEKKRATSCKEIMDQVAKRFNNFPIAHPAINMINKIKYGKEIDSKWIYETFAFLYTDNKKNSAIPLSSLWDENKEDAKLYLQLIAGYLKNESFQEEQEIRALFVPEKDDDDGHRKTKIQYFNTASKILRPFIDVVICDNKYQPLLPLKSIVIGPSGNQNAVFNSIIHRLEYGQTSIWDYWKHHHETDYDFFDDRFYDYVLGSIKQCMERFFYHINETSGEKIFKSLREKWEMENQLEEETNLCWEECKKRNEKKRIVEWNDSSDTNHERILNDILDYNYFSSQGIWIKTSKIPYIF